MPGRRRRSRLALLIVVLPAAVALLLGALASGERRERPDAPVPVAAAPSEQPNRDRARRGSSSTPERVSDRPSASEQGKGRERIQWRRSESVGTHSAGRLRRGVQLPARGREWVSWDPIEKRRPNRWWRRWGHERLVRTTLKVLRDFGRDHPNAPRVAVGDLSRPRGGDFGPQYGSIGHASHQNGLDVDIYYPRIDRRARPPKGPGEVDVRLAQDLVDRFVDAGAEKVFVGPNLPLDGPPDTVVRLVNHDNHLHARLPLT